MFHFRMRIKKEKKKKRKIKNNRAWEWWICVFPVTTKRKCSPSKIKISWIFRADIFAKFSPLFTKKKKMAVAWRAYNDQFCIQTLFLSYHILSVSVFNTYHSRKEDEVVLASPDFSIFNAFDLLSFEKIFVSEVYS